MQILHRHANNRAHMSSSCCDLFFADHTLPRFGYRSLECRTPIVFVSHRRFAFAASSGDARGRRGSGRRSAHDDQPQRADYREKRTDDAALTSHCDSFLRCQLLVVNSVILPFDMPSFFH
eukprot:2255230-Pleurochrysis_carterae.AAC.1